MEIHLLVPPHVFLVLPYSTLVLTCFGWFPCTSSQVSRGSEGYDVILLLYLFRFAPSSGSAGSSGSDLGVASAKLPKVP